MPRIAHAGVVNNPKRQGYDFRVDDYLLRAATTREQPMTIQSSDVQAQEINVKQNPEDFTRNIGQIYSRNNFSGGSNLDFAHKRGMSESDINKFWDSSGVSVFNINKGNPYDINLLHSTELKQALDSSDGDNDLAVVGTTVYVSNDNVLYKSTNGGDTWSTESHGLTAGYHIKGLAAHGDLLYIAANNGSAGELETWDGSTSTQKVSAAIYDGIWSVKGLMLVSAGTTLHQYDGATTVGSAIETLPVGQTWTDVVDAGAVILAVASDGRIYSIKDNAGTFASKGTTELKDEIPTCITESQGKIFYGTKVPRTDSKVIGRLYSADLVAADDLYVLANQQLIKEWNIDGVDASPNALFSTRDSVYTGIKESGSNSYLWRFYLPTAGIARDLKYGASGTIKAIGSIDEAILSTVQASGVYKETDNYEKEGYIITPLADFFTAEQKQWVEALLETGSVLAGEEVELYVSTEIASINDSTHSSWDKVVFDQEGNSLKTAQMDKISRYVTAKLVLKSQGNVTTPVVNSIQIRALARPELVVVQIPVNISDRVERPFRKPFTVKNLGETIYQSLKQKEGSPVTLEIYDPAEVIRGVVESIQYPIDNNVNVGSVTRVAILTIRGTRQTVSATVTSGDTFGINAFGIMRFG